MNNTALSIGRLLGHNLRGLRGLDRFLRYLHSPDRRDMASISGWFGAKWNGPEYYLDSRYFVEWGCLFYGSQDDRIHSLISTNLRPDWVGFDVGANFGFYSVLLATLAYEGHVHSFEPVTWLGERLMNNARHNKVEQRISLNSMAVSNATGVADLALPSAYDPNQGTASLTRRHLDWEKTRVPTITLDDYVRKKGLSRLDFIKIDVEGAEDLVIEGGLETLSRFRPIIVVEINSASDARVYELLSSIGYQRNVLPRIHCMPWFREDDNDYIYSCALK